MDLPHGLLTFIEVMQFGSGSFSVWYDILNTGFRITPTAGTDFPDSDSWPGREYFYTRISGPVSYEAWLEAVRRGRTFVTNGPLLEFQVNGHGTGDEIFLQHPEAVHVEAVVRFDPSRDDVQTLEVIENGDVLRSFSRVGESAEIRADVTHKVKQTSWLAVRANGKRVGEIGNRLAGAHSAALYVTVKDTPALADQPRARALAQTWTKRLEDLQSRLTEDKALAGGSRSPDLDAADDASVRANRVGLLEAVAAAKRRFRDLGR